jgi:4-hydroxy-tetrahydrodipicolinate reductase
VKLIRVAVVGALGRMGSGIIKNVEKEDDMQLVAAIEKGGNPHIGKDIGRLLGIGSLDVKLTGSDDLDATLADMAPDVLVDFSVADATVVHAGVASRNKVNLVIGTTGFEESQKIEMRKLVKENNVSAVISPNMATGVNIFFTVIRAVASIYKDCDVEIIEAHHRLKRDAPSGTAIRAGKLIAEAMGKDLDKDALYGRPKGDLGKRGNEIGFHAIRGGDIVGEHTVLFVGDGERLEITHRAHSRQAFVNGTIKAIRFAYEKRRSGKVFSTFDVLGL